MLKQIIEKMNLEDLKYAAFDLQCGNALFHLSGKRSCL